MILYNEHIIQKIAIELKRLEKINERYHSGTIRMAVKEIEKLLDEGQVENEHTDKQ